MHPATWEALRRIEGKLDRLLEAARASATRMTEMATDLKSLETEVAANRDATDSAVVLLDNLAQLLEDAKSDPALVQQLADNLRGNSTKLAEAVLRNTPQAPPAPQSATQTQAPKTKP